MMNLEIAKENLIKMKPLKYLEALESKMELIKNKNKLNFNIDVNEITIINIENKYYLKYAAEDIDNYEIAQAEKDF